MKEVVSPKIVNLYNQTATTNKFSNFGFFAGSPRQTAMAGVSGNINQDEQECVVDIEEAIEENLEHVTRQRQDLFVKKQRTVDTRQDPPELQMTNSPDLPGKRKQQQPVSTKPDRRKQDDALRVSAVPDDGNQTFVELNLDNTSEDKETP